MNSKNRLLQYIEYKGIKKVDFYKATGLSNGFLDKNANISSDKIEIISSTFEDLSIDWLVSGRGEMIITNERGGVGGHPEICEYSMRTDRVVATCEVPLYDLAATAGLASLFIDKANQIPIDYIKIPNLPRCDGAVYVTGDSMYPLLKAGDIVLYKQISDIVNNLFWGEMYLISFDMDAEEFIAVKFVQKSELADHIKLVSQNQHHSPFDIHISRIRAMALIKASIRMNAIR